MAFLKCTSERAKRKEVSTLRPIVSSIGTYDYKVAKFLTRLLAPVIPKEYCTNDTFSFIKEIKEEGSCDKFLVSFDVTS